VVTTTSGRTRRISRTIFSRTSSVGSSSPSSYPRNSTCSTPTTLADARASASRISANRPRVISGSLDPAAPFVTSAYVTCAPSCTHRATVPAHPNSISSGCAATTNTRFGVQYSIHPLPVLLVVFSTTSAHGSGSIPPPRGDRKWNKVAFTPIDAP
jgi:hypothetical protein